MQPSPPKSSYREVLNDPNWRHPHFGFAAADLPNLVCIGLPRGVREDDVKALIARAGLKDAKILMNYYIETGKPGSLCYLRIADENKVDAAIAALSRLTLLGSELNPEKFDFWKDSLTDEPSLMAGWLPSPTNNLQSRVVRPARTEPPKLLPALMGEQWVRFSNLPPVELEAKDAYLPVAQAFYKMFYKYDVVGITALRRHRTRATGWYCDILFGNRDDAKAARTSHTKKHWFMGRRGVAKIFRGGPNIHNALWKYRQSLPEDTPDAEVGRLLEEKYKEIYKVHPADLQRRQDYPTPESAVGF